MNSLNELICHFWFIQQSRSEVHRRPTPAREYRIASPPAPQRVKGSNKRRLVHILSFHCSVFVLS
jgi:hypothetical protein